MLNIEEPHFPTSEIYSVQEILCNKQGSLFLFFLSIPLGGKIKAETLSNNAQKLFMRKVITINKIICFLFLSFLFLL